MGKRYSELIKKIETVRQSVRDFYLFGKSRSDYDGSEKNIYDINKRRISSYFSDLIYTDRESRNKKVYIYNNENHASNFLFALYKAKSSTVNDLVLHFIILDILADTRAYTISEIADKITEYGDSFVPDLNTIRNKLNEYVELGILFKKTESKTDYYTRRDDECVVDFDMISFFSENDILGVIGSYILDKSEYENNISAYSFKHRFMFPVLDNMYLVELFDCIKNKQIVTIKRTSNGNTETKQAIPLKILINRENGRQYVASFLTKEKIFYNFRIDRIVELNIEKNLVFNKNEFYNLRKTVDEKLSHTWSVNFYNNTQLQKIEMILVIGDREEFIIRRLKREGHNGTITQISSNLYRYENYVFDAKEAIPWVKSFIGRIVSFKCDDKSVEDKLTKDIAAIKEVYKNEI